MWGVSQTGRGRRAQRRMTAWARYQRRCDRLAGDQDMTCRLEPPIRTTPGYFRAEGWRTDARSVLRHGG